MEKREYRMMTENCAADNGKGAKRLLQIFSVLLILTAAGSFLSCGNNKNTDTDSAEGRTAETGRQVIDAAGRTVTVPENLDGGIVTIGSCGPLRFLSIFDVYDSIIEVDKGDVTDSRNGRAYSYAYPYNTFEPEQYHPGNKLESETVEKIGSKNPGLIIVQSRVYNNYRENCELLGSQFPLVVIPAQSMTELWNENYELADWYVQTVDLIGTMVGRPERAAEHIADVNGIMADIRSLTGESGKGVYIAGLTWQGSNELTTTFPTYLPLMLVDGKNAHGGDEKSRVVMDPEVVTGIDMDYLVIDPSSADKLSTPNSQLILEWVHKRNSDGNPDNNIRIFATLPMVWDSANYDCVLAGSYYLAHLLYGTLSAEETESRINNVFTAYYGENGKNVLEDIKLFFQEKSAAYNVELPPLSEIEIIPSESGFSVRAR